MAPLITDWIASGAASAALLTAAWAAFTANRSHQLEQQRASEAQAREEREQASQVAAWPEARYAAHPHEQGWYIVVRNASELPIYDVEVELDVVTTSAAEGTWHIAPEMVTPGQKDSPAPVEVGRRLADLSTKDPRLRLTLRFTDTTGQKWVRGAHGELHKRPADDLTRVAVRANPWRPMEGPA